MRICTSTTIILPPSLPPSLILNTYERLGPGGERDCAVPPGRVADLPVVEGEGALFFQEDGREGGREGGRKG